MKKIKPAAIKPTIKFSDLEKIDIRIGTIEKVLDIEKSDTLVKPIAYADKIKPVLAIPEKKVLNGVRVE